MVDQASMRANGPVTATGRVRTAQASADTSAADADRDSNGPANVVSNVAEFGEDVLSLMELQTRLAAIELKQNAEAVKFGGAVILTGIVLALAGMPIALAGIAELLVSQFGMNHGLALLVVAIAAFALAGTAIAIAAARLRSSNLGFPLSQEEFARNVNWLRTVLLHSGRSKRGRVTR
jgi:uncharacterized membrane protein YqjE